MTRFFPFISVAISRYHPVFFLKILTLPLLSFAAFIIVIGITLGLLFVTIGIRSPVFLHPGSCLPVNLDWTLERDKIRRKIVLRCIQCSGGLTTKLKAMSRNISIILNIHFSTPARFKRWSLLFHENHDIAIAMSSSRADPVLPWLGVFKCFYQSHCTDWGHLNV